jgi:hypothetical protein
MWMQRQGEYSRKAQQQVAPHNGVNWVLSFSPFVYPALNLVFYFSFFTLFSSD